MQSDISQIISVKWLYENLGNDNLIILDASIKKIAEATSFSSEEWIPNTRYFDLKGKFSDTEAEFPTTIPPVKQFQREARILGINQDSIIVIYDNKGIYSSARAWWLFKTFGFENVAVLDGGLPEWKRLVFKTVNILASQRFTSGNFIATYKSENVRFFNDILKIQDDTSCLILDARSEGRFNEIIPEPREGLRSGTIPQSKNLPYTILLNGHCLKSKAELLSIFSAFNIADKSITFSCGSGITACILLLAAKICKFHKLSIYDGSWTEYGTLKHNYG